MLNVLCKRDWCIVEYPVWPMCSRDLAPSTLSTYPPLYLPGVVGTQFTGSLQEGWIWTVKWRFAASLSQILCFWIMHAILSLFHLESCFWSVYQMIGCLVLIAVMFFGWLTTTRNKHFPHVRSSHFPGLCHEHDSLTYLRGVRNTLFQGIEHPHLIQREWTPLL